MRTRSWLNGVLLAAGLAVSLAGPVLAQKSADTLRVTTRSAIPNVDPYYNQLREGIILAHHAWDYLLYRDPETFRIKPLLESPTYTVPVASTAMPRGPLKRAPEPVPLVLPKVVVPASVLTSPVSVTLRISLFSVSAT